MRKSIYLSIMFLLSINGLYSQTIEQNLNKYWYYRKRLKEQFMVVSNGNEQGTNIPAGHRHYQGRNSNKIKWGDATIYLANYISVLATEYKLLKDNEQDCSETLQELYNAMSTLERLDVKAELYWGNPNLQAPQWLFYKR